MQSKKEVADLQITSSFILYKKTQEQALRLFVY